MTPQACVPVFLTDPSRAIACFIVFAARSVPSAIDCNSPTFIFSSERNSAILDLLFLSSPKM
jgi:hypothetical protein